MTLLTFAAGTFLLAQTVFTAADQPVTIQCAGPDQTVLIAPGGLSITYDSEFAAPTLDGCTIATDQAAGGTALTITGPLLATSTQQGPSLTRLSIRGDNVQTHYWTQSIKLVRTWNAIVRDVNVKGLDQPIPPFLMMSCLEMDTSQVVSVERFDCYHAQDGIRQTGATYGEGFSLRMFNLVGVDRGLDLHAGSGYIVGPGHINAARRCADINKTQIKFDGVLCYKTHTSTADFVGFYPSVASQVLFVDSIVDGGWGTAHLNSGATYGWVLGVTDKSLISGSLCTNFKTPSACIVVGSGSHDNTIVNNRSDGAGPVVQINGDAGTGNYSYGNRP